MGKLSTTHPVLKNLNILGRSLWAAIKKIGTVLYAGYERVWVWLRLRLPFLEALVQRHLDRPATVIVDFAVFLLIIYIGFGVTGYVKIYQQKSESRFTETVSTLYPLPAVRVDQSYEWSHRFLERLRFLTTFQKQAPQEIVSAIPTDAQLREKVLAGLVEDKIVLLEAQKRGIRVTKEELDAAYEQQKKTNQDFEKRIKALYGMSPSDFQEVLAERILKEKVKASVITRVKVRHILTATESAAQEAKKQIESGKIFETAAREFSQDTQTKDTGGDLGYWTKGELASQVGPGFEEAAFNGEVNKILGPVQTRFGHHLIQILERTGDNYQTYDEWYNGVKTTYKIRIYIPI